ncbi:MAG: hypothetical protein M1831_005198 [Alyxoria varia]|nr:MAG: hypothetical protein M1831_005198 [Alyxoria varia]
MPRFLILLHGDAASESGVMPSKDTFGAMHAYNTSLKNSGIFLGGEGLHETAKGARVNFPPADQSSTTSGGATQSPDQQPTPKDNITVTPGPFEYSFVNPSGQYGGPTRPVCGFWIFKAKDLEEAVEWVKKGPLGGTYVEIRRIHEFEDLNEMPKEMKEEEEGWRKELEENK